MDKPTAQQNLINFRNELYPLFPKRADAIMNLLDATCSHAHQCNSVVSLSEASAFKREYSSITDAIADGLPNAQWDKINIHVYDTFSQDNKVSCAPHRFVLDCTGNPRPYAKKSSDRTINHAPNPAPGNKPIAVGHQYSIIAALPNNSLAANKHWVLPVSSRRIESSCKGHEEGMVQLSETIDTLNLDDKLTMSVGDSLYGTQQCRESAVGIANHIHLFRLNSTRNIYNAVDDFPLTNKKSKGRQKRYGKKIALKKLHDELEPDVTTSTPYTNNKGKQYTIHISMWKDKLLRGTRAFKSFEHPINVICFEMRDAKGNAVFKNKCWVAVLGKRRHEISALDACKHYRSRYDIEHFFRFCKTKLLIDKDQTPDTTHEENWWSLCLLAYAQLFFAKECVTATAKKWEKYLPAFKYSNKTLYSPSLTQRGFAKLLTCIDTPARPCIIRGITPGRAIGDLQTKRTRHPIIFKTKSIKKEQRKTINPGSEHASKCSDPQKIEDLIDLCVKSLKKFGVSIDKYFDLLRKQPITA